MNKRREQVWLDKGYGRTGQLNQLQGSGLQRRANGRYRPKNLGKQAQRLRWTAEMGTSRSIRSHWKPGRTVEANGGPKAGGRLRPSHRATLVAPTPGLADGSVHVMSQGTGPTDKGRAPALARMSQGRWLSPDTAAVAGQLQGREAVLLGSGACESSHRESRQRLDSLFLLRVAQRLARA